MHKTFRALGAVGALLCFTATIAVAQNNSDHNATSIAGASVGGFYSPGNRAGGRPAVTAASLADEERALAGGSAAERMVGAVLSGGSTTALANSLTAAGAPAAQVNALMSALTALGSNPSPASLQNAIRAYNALIRAAPAGFINNAPASILAIRAALVHIQQARA
jgi:hypothetical protein